MATIQQAIALMDGVSPVLNKIGQAVDRTIGKFQRAAGAATNMENAGRVGANGIRNAVTVVIPVIDTLSAHIDNLNTKLQNMGRGAFKEMQGALSGLTGQIAMGNILADIISSAGRSAIGLVQKLVSASDEYAGIQARLKLVAGDAEKAAQMNEQIYQSALRARGSYTNMADSVAKIAMTAKEAFPKPQDVVPFVEGIQKLFVIGGTSAEQAKNAMLQLTQALGSGRLQGDEFRSIAEAAPLIEQMVAKTMGVSQGALKQLAAEGEVTAEIIKRAIFENMSEIDEMFEKMPMTWEQRFTILGTKIDHAFNAVKERLNDFANTEAMSRLCDSVVAAADIAAVAVMGIINNIEWATNMIVENWAVVEPILMGLAAVLISGVAVGIYTVSAALLASPITWYVAVVMLLVGAFYAVIQMINHFCGTSISATGIIFGAFAWLVTGLVNVFKFFGNYIIAFANFLGSVWVDPLGAAYNLFVDIWSAIADYVGQAVNSIIDMIKQIPGIDKVLGNIGHVEMPKLARKEIAGAAWNIKPFEYGSQAQNAMDAYNIGANGINVELPKVGAPEIPDIGDSNSEPKEGKAAKDTADNTGRMADAMDIQEEDLKYLRDIAEQEAINRYTTAEVNIEMGGISNNISNNMDLDGVVTYLNDSLLEAMQAGAEEVHPV